jgi:hypothetical protein
MNWEAIGAIGEIVGAFAVVVTVGYLAFQIRQNTREIRLSAFQTITDRIHQWNSDLARDPDLARIYANGLVDPGSLKEGEWIRFEAHVVNQLRTWEDTFLHHRNALVEEEVWAARQAHFRKFLVEPGFRRVWKRRRNSYARGFQEFVDREIDTVSSDDPSSSDCQ